MRVEQMEADGSHNERPQTGQWNFSETHTQTYMHKIKPFIKIPSGLS